MHGLITPVGSFFWNLDENVGLRSPNLAEDVQYVQFGYYCMAQPEAADLATADEQEVFSRVTPGASYTGAEGDPLTVAIRLHQAKRGGVQDGHVSSVRGKTGGYTQGTETRTFMLNTLYVACYKVLKRFPRLDHHPRCPTLVADKSRYVFTLD